MDSDGGDVRFDHSSVIRKGRANPWIRVWEKLIKQERDLFHETTFGTDSTWRKRSRRNWASRFVCSTTVGTPGTSPSSWTPTSNSFRIRTASSAACWCGDRYRKVIRDKSEVQMQ